MYVFWGALLAEGSVTQPPHLLDRKRNVINEPSAFSHHFLAEI